MLACVQRRQPNLSSQRLACTPKSLDVPSSLLLLPSLQPQLQPQPQLPPRPHVCKGEPASTAPRYPSPAELDAFAQKTANSPLSIKIFPADVRVPQHKQLNKTVNGLDTTGQRYSPYPQPYQGLLAVVRASAAAAALRGVLKNPEGRRTKHGGSQTAAQVAPYANPLAGSGGGGYPGRRGHRAYHSGSCKPPNGPAETLCSGAAPAPGDQSLAAGPRPQLAQVQSLMSHVSRIPSSRVHLQVGGEARASPSLQAVAARSDFAAGVPPPQSSLALTGAVIPTQGRAKAGYAGAWLPHKHQVQQLYHHQHQQHQQGALSVYGVVSGGVQGYGAKEAGPEPRVLPGCSAQTAYMPPPHPTGVEQLSAAATAASLSHQGELSVGPYFAPLWDGAVATPHSDCYTSQVLRPGDLGMSHLHPNFYHHRQLHPQRQQLPPALSHTQAYSADPNLCCGLPAPSLCHAAAAAVLSGSSLQSLECLISEIQPPCIKERMLGRGYDAAGMPVLLEHHPQSHIQLPVHR